MTWARSARSKPGSSRGDSPPRAARNLVSPLRVSPPPSSNPAVTPAPGGQRNGVEESPSDRPWHEREWLRVDWATSQVDGRAFSGAAGRVPHQARFFVQAHEQNADAPRLIEREGRAVHFDATATVRQRSLIHH